MQLAYLDFAALEVDNVCSVSCLNNGNTLIQYNSILYYVQILLDKYCKKYIIFLK